MARQTATCRTFSLALALAMALTAVPAAMAQEAEPEAAQETRVGDIDVIGRSRREAARAFVDTVATAPAGARLARWTIPVCIGVAGARAEVAQAMIDRIADVVVEVGAEVAPPGCTPNVVVVMTEDGRAMAQAMVRRDRERFNLGIGNSSLSRAALERFRTSDAAIRWWHTSVPLYADSGELAGRFRGSGPPGADAVARGGVGAAAFATRNPSRMRSGVRHDLNSVTVIVDITRLEGASLTALSDFIAMLALAQIDPQADFSGQPTVLNLMLDPPGAHGLTEWDWAYLRGLYTARPDRASASAQEAEVARELLRHRAIEARESGDD